MTEPPFETSGTVRFVQFPHPGPEHDMPLSGTRAWPPGNAPHRRTFVQSPAAYRREIEGPAEHGEVAFWGEWEGEAQLVAPLEQVPDGPRWLCRANPQGSPPPIGEHGKPPQNTDPFVWGDPIRYAACRQPTNAKLRNLGRGSLVLFGSSLGGQFVLDTVLVVAGWVEHRRDTYRDVLATATSAEHMRATLEPWHGWNTDTTYRLYVGATPENSIDGMFSFVPCRPLAGVRSGFARPAITLPGLINPNLRQQASSSEPMLTSDLTPCWRDVASQVVEHALALATRLDLS